MKQFFYLLAQFTWGIIENILGFFCFLFFITKKHDLYDHKSGIKVFRTHISSKYSGSFSLGNFIFVCENSDHTLKHETGHCYQNLIFGPLSLLIFKIPSVIHFWICEIKNDFSHYEEFYPERSANRLGGNIAKLKKED